MSKNNQQPHSENPKNQFSNSEPMTFAQKVDYVKNVEMTNKKQQTEANVVEYLSAVNQFAEDNNTHKPKEQTAVEWLVEQFKEYDFADVKDTENYIIKMQSFVLTEKLDKAKEMEKEQTIKTSLFWSHSTVKRKDIEDYYEQTYGGNK